MSSKAETEKKVQGEVQSHRRYNPLTGEYILCSPHRVNRPWQGNLEASQLASTVEYDQKCYLCPNNFRVGGTVQNPNYEDVYLFDNDFSAVKMDTIDDSNTQQGEGEEELENGLELKDLERKLLVNEKVHGICKVICYTSNHSKTLATLSLPAIIKIVATWKSTYIQYSTEKPKSLKYIQIFENKGEAMGCSNPHPHGQIWITSSVPSLVQREIVNLTQYQQDNCSCMLCDTVKLELSKKIRILDETEHFISIVPYWATWPFEVLVLAKNHLSNLTQFTNETVADLALMLKFVTTRYDNLFNCSFPYSMGLHQSPLACEEVTEEDKFHFHIHFYPPLLRNQSIRKWMVGYEMLAESQRDITPEMAVEKLRLQSKEKHYLDN